MLDWLTFEVPCYHREPIHGDRILAVTRDGEHRWETRKRHKVRGSHDATIHVRTLDYAPDGSGLSLEIDGNPVKFLQGHNVFGSDDVVGLSAETMERLTVLLSLDPTGEDRAAWWAGKARLRRVDVNASWELGSRAEVRAWLRAAAESSHLRHRGRGEMKEGTLYWGKHSRRWALKAYAKADEIEAKGRELPAVFLKTSLPVWADNKLRIERVTRQKELQRLGLEWAYSWTETTGRELLADAMGRLTMSDYTVSDETIQALPGRLRMVYQCWKDGHDLRELHSRPTFYRYRKALLDAAGVDIAVKQPREDRSNVVPLVRVLEAVPASIPDWAYGTELLFEPRRKHTA